MIDVENVVYTAVVTKLREKFPGISTSGALAAVPEKFPCVFFTEDDNYTSQEDLDTSDSEKISYLRYRADVYSNKATGSKAEAKAIVSAIDEVLYGMNFTRFSRTALNDVEKGVHYVVTWRVKSDGTNFYRI